MEKTKKEIHDTVVESISVVLCIEPGEINEKTELIDDLGMESIDFLDFSHELESKIGLEINFEDLMESVSDSAIVVKSLVDYIYANQS